jgi:hypothetical protein
MCAREKQGGYKMMQDKVLERLVELAKEIKEIADEQGLSIYAEGHEYNKTPLLTIYKYFHRDYDFLKPHKAEWTTNEKCIEDVIVNIGTFSYVNTQVKEGEVA